MRHGQRQRRVLLHQQHGYTALGVDAHDDGKNLFHQFGRESERGLIEQDQLGLRNQRAANRQHLLLATREVTGQTLAALVQARKIGIDQIEVRFDTAAACQRVAGGDQVFFDRQVLKNAPAFHHMAQALTHQLLRLQRRGGLAVEADAATLQLAVFEHQQARDRFQRG